MIPSVAFELILEIALAVLLPLDLRALFAHRAPTNRGWHIGTMDVQTRGSVYYS